MNYEIVRSDRKTMSMEVSPDGRVIVRIPKKCTDKTAMEFVAEHEQWLQRALIKTKKRAMVAKEYEIPESEKDKYVVLAKSVIPKKVEYWSKITGLVPTSVKITSAKKRYGSCSFDNHLCFSYRLMAYPDEAIDYVVVHELAHIVHKNHSRQFYSLIEQYLPNYKETEKILNHKGVNNNDQCNNEGF